MPLERKILFTILSTVILFFGYWFYYTEIITPNREILKKIEKLESYILKWSRADQNILPENFEAVFNRAEELDEFFSSKETFSMDQFAGEIRAVLTDNNVIINQFRTGESSVTFYISGNSTGTLRAIWELSNKKPLYKFETLQLRVNQDRNLQGVLTMSPLFYPVDVYLPYLKDTVRGLNYRGQYQQKLPTIWGHPPIATAVTVTEVTKTTQPEVKINRTNKFTYIGMMKGNDVTTYMFRETTNGRVFIYSLGENISGWILEEINSGAFIFKNQDTLYEVKE